MSAPYGREYCIVCWEPMLGIVFWGPRGAQRLVNLGPKHGAFCATHKAVGLRSVTCVLLVLTRTGPTTDAVCPYMNHQIQDVRSRNEQKIMWYRRSRLEEDWVRMLMVAGGEEARPRRDALSHRRRRLEEDWVRMLVVADL